jgi:hypothetical protein
MWHSGASSCNHAWHAALCHPASISHTACGGIVRTGQVVRHVYVYLPSNCTAQRRCSRSARDLRATSKVVTPGAIPRYEHNSTGILACKPYGYATFYLLWAVMIRLPRLIFVGSVCIGFAAQEGREQRISHTTTEYHFLMYVGNTEPEPEEQVENAQRLLPK